MNQIPSSVAEAVRLLTLESDQKELPNYSRKFQKSVSVSALLPERGKPQVAKSLVDLECYKPLSPLEVLQVPCVLSDKFEDATEQPNPFTSMCDDAMCALAELEGAVAGFSAWKDDYLKQATTIPQRLCAVIFSGRLLRAYSDVCQTMLTVIRSVRVYSGAWEDKARGIANLEAEHMKQKKTFECSMTLLQSMHERLSRSKTSKSLFLWDYLVTKRIRWSKKRISSPKHNLKKQSLNSIKQSSPAISNNSSGFSEEFIQSRGGSIELPEVLSNSNITAQEEDRIDASKESFTLGEVLELTLLHVKRVDAIRQKYEYILFNLEKNRKNQSHFFKLLKVLEKKQKQKKLQSCLILLYIVF